MTFGVAPRRRETIIQRRATAVALSETDLSRAKRATTTTTTPIFSTAPKCPKCPKWRYFCSRGVVRAGGHGRKEEEEEEEKAGVEKE